ncbi:MAG TPA: arylsulfatase [Candidatus Avipropionibacterium avicola]|uniref:Arylsulfatase n=1 Tax=Candidatus Avipropionibacterium avicola TaxID=2840701 RepID=A0A9D1GWZ0_9ACTN|nr:arylsulfatase [Candidatus Avipropionibacterium avicola]
MRTERANIILITTDQQRGDCLGVDGHPVVQTPNMDWLARSGVRFRRAYSECPSCVPGRRTLMTGQAPARQGMVGMTKAAWDPKHTLAGEFSRAGYQTEMIGKLAFSPYRKRYGFDHMELADSTHEFRNGGKPANDYLTWLAARGEFDGVEPGVAHGVSPNGWVGRPSHLPEHLSHSYWLTNTALDFLDRRDPEAPFFLNLSYIDPHPPMTPPAFYYERYMAMDLPKPVVGDWAPRFDEPERGLDINQWRIRIDDAPMKQARAGYYGLINHVDNQLGRLIGQLRKQQLLKDTLILFTSDHGEMLGDHNMWRKTFPYEASARIPFFIKPAEGMDLPGEVVSSAPVGLQDVMPTLLEAAGLPIPETCTGRSVLPLAHGDSDGWREYIHGEHAGQYDYDDGMHYLTDGHQKYVWYSQTGREHLFDLDTDPDELHDLTLDASDDSADLQRWRDRLVDTLRERPEGFVAEDRLVVGRPHEMFVPGMEPS